MNIALVEETSKTMFYELLAARLTEFESTNGIYNFPFNIPICCLKYQTMTLARGYSRMRRQTAPSQQQRQLLKLIKRLYKRIIRRQNGSFTTAITMKSNIRPSRCMAGKKLVR